MQQIPVQVTFRHMNKLPSLESQIHDLAEALRQRFHRIQRCDIVMERRPYHKQGNPCVARLHVTVPGKEIVVSRECKESEAHAGSFAAVNDAFAAVGRQLEHKSPRTINLKMRHPLPN